MGSPDEFKFKIAILGGLYVNEPATREILLFLARHYVEGYRKKDKDIVSFLSKVVLHFIPYFEQNENSYEKICSTDDQAVVTAPLLIATNQQDEQKTTDNLWKMLQREQFDMMFSLEGGSISIKLVYLIAINHIMSSIMLLLTAFNLYIYYFIGVQQFIQGTQFL